MGVDGILYLKVLDAERASYGISNYQLCHSSTLPDHTCVSESAKSIWIKPSRSASNINLAVVSEVDKASEPWGVKVLRYEIKNINPPQDVLSAMEKQMRAEREKRAVDADLRRRPRRRDQHRRR